MNFAHIHLMLNHIPVVGLPVALAFLILGYLNKNLATQRIALGVLALLALIAIPVYFTGEPAEDVIENLAGVSKELIEVHEDAALISTLLSGVTGLVSLLTLVFFGNEKIRIWMALTLILGLVSTLSLAYTANLGGKVRHSEIRTNGSVDSSPTVKDRND